MDYVAKKVGRPFLNRTPEDQAARDEAARQWRRQYYLANRERMCARQREYHQQRRAAKKAARAASLGPVDGVLDNPE